MNKENLINKEKTKKKQKLTKPSNLSLARSGFNIVVPDIFIDTYLSIYNSLIKDSKEHKPSKEHYITREEAELYCYIVFESIVSCLDFGISIWFRGIMQFCQKIATYRLNRNTSTYKTRTQDAKIVTITLAYNKKRKLRDKLNKDNEEWVQYRKEQKNNYLIIKDYYKEFYGKEGEWWTFDDKTQLQ